MKNTATLVSIILLLLVIIPICKANVIVSPAEISITMTDTFIDGNTTKKITVKNHFPYNISVNAWMMHPDIIGWMRPNRTLIENISWITIEPSELIIPSNSSSQFYIYFAIPDNETKNQTRGKHWEIWAALKINAASENTSSSFKQGYLVRIYVDTPVKPSSNGPTGPDQIFYDTLIAIMIAIIVTMVYYFYMRAKRKQQQ